MRAPAAHERFLGGLELFPSGPWKRVAAFVGTKTARQTMTHAQKYRQKIERRRRALEQQARETQSTMNGSNARSSISTVAGAPATEASAPPANSEDLCVEREPKPIVLPGRDNATLESRILESFYNGELSGGDEGSGEDLNRWLFEELLWDANNLADQQLLLGVETTSEPLSFPPSSLDKPFAFGSPLNGGKSTLDSSSYWKSSHAWAVKTSSFSLVSSHNGDHGLLDHGETNISHKITNLSPETLCKNIININALRCLIAPIFKGFCRPFATYFADGTHDQF